MFPELFVILTTEVTDCPGKKLSTLKTGSGVITIPFALAWEGLNNNKVPPKTAIEIIKIVLTVLAHYFIIY